MFRFFYNELIEWKNSAEKKPLLVKGVRQCGKSYIIEKFGKENYSDYAKFVFEGNEELKKIFEKNLDVDRILDELSYLRGKKITEKTLIFFDEIQFCDAAISSLKYFYENRPEYNIVCAGSLLGLKLSKKLSNSKNSYSYPVGKVEVKTLFPMNFLEFLNVVDEYSFKNIFQKNKTRLEETELNNLNKIYHEYLAIGGMPEAVKSWKKNRDAQKINKIHKQIISDYLIDIMKFAPTSQVTKITEIWHSFSTQLAKENSRFFFNRVVNGGRASQLEEALQWLLDAGLLYKVPMITKPNIPQYEYQDSNKFKVYCCDCGLLHANANISTETVLLSETFSPYCKGSFTENFVCEELKSMLKETNNIFYWKGENIRHEVDFVIHFHNKVIPIEVKSGKVGKYVSLQEYVEKYNPEYAFLLSPNNIKVGKIIHLPLFMIFDLDNYIDH